MERSILLILDWVLLGSRMGPYPFPHGEPAMMRLRRRDEGISMVLVIVLVVFTLIITVGAAIFWANYKDAERRAALIRRETERQDAEIAVITAQLSRVNEATGLKTGDEGRLSAP